jgi:signal peptidase I
MSKFRFCTFAALAASCLFSLLSINFAADISVLAFLVAGIFTAIAVYYAVFLFKKYTVTAIPVLRKLLQYIPYILLIAFVLRRAGKTGTAYWYDVVTVVLWCLVFIFSLAALYYLNEKRVYSFRSEWQQYIEKNPRPVFHGWRRVAFEIVDWVDALVQAVFMILLIQIFILQLYVIPSESMVPQFLIKDRVFVFKTASGPKFPLSDIGVPCMRNYKRGDVIVFRNPHYSMDRKSEVTTVTSQLVYMLTFTTVNLNRDEKGEPKADPLVKRITGVPGEQLVMQDGTLYVRTKNTAAFEPVPLDNKFAAWNLNAVKPVVRQGIKSFPLSQEQYELMLECEKDRRELNIADAAAQCRSISTQFETFAQPKSRQGKMSADGVSLFEYDLFSGHDTFARKLLSADGGAVWFASFMTDWTRQIPVEGSLAGGDIYRDANYRLNIMVKLCLGQMLLRDAQLIASGTPSAQWNADKQLYTLMTQAEMLNMYVMILDQRNMPVFPADSEDGSPRYIPENCYFMMGDNRFNSLDMRHSYEEKLVSLTPLDAYSVMYYSNMQPQFVNRKYILGTAVFCFWPIGRVGIIKTK